MKRSTALKIVCLLGLMCWYLPARAACPFTVALTTPSPAQFDMGTTSTGTFRITNSGSPSNITVLRFRFNNGDVFSGTTTAPAGWTVAFSSASGGGYKTITYTATAGGIAASGSASFPIAIIFHSLGADAASESLRDIRATYSASCGGSTTATVSAQPTWSLKSLVITLTPSSTSVSRACTGAFTLTMHVTNNSTTSLTGVISAPQPPTLNVLSGSPAPNATTASTPSISLAAGASGDLIWTYATNNNIGTISFTASARDSANTRTSKAITSTVITVTNTSCLITDFPTSAPFAPNPSPACDYSGKTFTFTMRVTNNTGVTLSAVTASALTKAGTAAIAVVTSPSPIASLANGGTANLVWTATVTGNPDATYFVTASASGTNGGNTYSSQPGTSALKVLGGFLLDVTPNTVTALSTSQQMDWTITNHGCNPVKKVSIPIPAGWTWSHNTTNDTYSTVDTGGPNPVEDWIASDGGTSADFTAGSNLPISLKGTFSVTLSTPTTSGTTPFSATVTDTNNQTSTIFDPSSITTNAFNSGSPSPNDTRRGTPWREIFQ